MKHSLRPLHLAILACLPLAACDRQTTPYEASFIAHLQANAGDRDPACLERALRARWPDQQTLFAEANRQRPLRGETDAVNYALGQLNAACRTVKAATNAGIRQ
jgi:hypothetical protein